MSDVQQGPDWWLASDGRWYPPQPPDTPPPPPATPQVPASPAASVRTGASASQARWWAVSAASVVAVGALLPWVEARSGFTGVVRSGLDGDGVITLVVAILAAGAAIVGWSRWIVVGAGLVVGAVAIIDIVDVMDVADSPVGQMAGVSVGIGLWLTLLGSALLVGAGLVRRDS